MKTIIVAALVSLALARGAMGTTVDPWLSGWRVSTNVDGMVLTLEFADVSVVAGERLDGRMIVSNASQSVYNLDYHRGSGWQSRIVKHTKIGQFVVEDDER